MNSDPLDLVETLHRGSPPHHSLEGPRDDHPTRIVPVVEHCRHWSNAIDRCGRPAVVIVWGKLADPTEFGPRCPNHLPKWLDMGRIDQYAVFDLRGIYREEQL